MAHDVTYISVVVPFHNSERYISGCIQSLLSQEYPLQNYEIIMVDNNSTDRSAEIVKSYSRVKLIFEKKQGSYAARNRGVGKSKGEIIAFTDSDCVPDCNWLKEIELAMSDVGVGIAIGSHRLANNSHSLSLLEDYENEKNSYIFGSEIKELYYGYTRNMAVRRKIFEEIGPFMERSRGSDVIFVHQCIDTYPCETIRYFPRIMVRHMEIDSPRKYFRKVSIYGNSSQKYRHIVYARPLTYHERFLVFRKTVQNQGYSFIKSTFLLALLIIGIVYWILGNISGAYNFRQNISS